MVLRNALPQSSLTMLSPPCGKGITISIPCVASQSFLEKFPSLLSATTMIRFISQLLMDASSSSGEADVRFI